MIACRRLVPCLLTLFILGGATFDAAAQGIPIFGRILDPDSKGVAGARVELRRVLPLWDVWHAEVVGDPLPEPIATAQTNDSGGFYLTLPESDLWQLDVDAPGFVPRRFRIESPNSAERQEFYVWKHTELPLTDHSAVITLISFDKPVRNAVIGVGGLPVAVTDDHGRAKVPLPDFKHCHFEAVAPNGQYLTWTIHSCTSFIQTVEIKSVTTFEGRVVDADSGLPVVGAAVDEIGKTMLFIRTDSQGKYRYRTYDVWGNEKIRVSYSLRVSAPGYLRGKTVRIVDPTPGTVNPVPLLRLERAAVTSGVVVDRAGQPVAGARLKIVPASRSRRDGYAGLPGDDSTLPDGRFAITHPRRPFHLEAQSEDFPNAWISPDPVGPDDSEIRIVLDRGHTVRGRIVDATGTGLGGAEIAMVPWVDPGSWDRSEVDWSYLSRAFRTTSRDDGSFELTDMGKGPHELGALRSEFVRRRWGNIVVPAGEGVVEIGDRQLEAGATLEVRVVDEAGHAIQGATVSAFNEDTRLSSNLEYAFGDFDAKNTLVAVTDTEGHAVLRDLPRVDTAEDSLFVVVRHPDYLTSEAWLKAPTDGSVQVELEQGALISGRVVDPSGAAVPGAQVLGVKSDRHGNSKTEAETEADDTGSFEIGPLKLGTLELFAQDEGWARSKRRSFELVHGTDLRGIQLVLRQGAVVEGRLRQRDGRSLGGARMVVRDPSRISVRGWPVTTTDAEGRFRLEGVLPGRSEIEISSDGRQDWLEVEAQPGHNALDLTVATRFTVTGRVIGPDGEPARASLDLEGAEIHAWTRHEGRFRMSLEPGQYQLRALAEGFTDPGPTLRFEVIDRDVEGLELRLSRGTTLRGVVHGVEPDALEMGRVWASPALEVADSKSVSIDRDGRYSIPLLAPGIWWFTAEVGGRGRIRRVTLAPGQETVEMDFDLSHPGKASLAGRVAVDSVPTEGISVGAMSAAPGDGEAYFISSDSGADGRFLIRGLAATHRYRLFARHEPLRSVGPAWWGKVDLEAGDEIEIGITTVALTGRVRSEDGSPLAGAVVELQADPHDWWFRHPSVETDTMGRFELPPVVAGQWWLTVRRDGSAPSTSELRLDRSSGDVELTLATAVCLDLLLDRDSQGHRPRGVSVHARNRDGRQQPVMDLPVESGRVHLPKLSAGEWTLMIYTREELPRIAELSLRVPAEEAVRVALLPAATLKVRAPELEGDLLDSAKVRIFDAAGRRVDLFRSEDTLMAGRAALAPLPAGIWKVVVEALDGRKWEGRAETFAGQVTEVEVD